MAKFILVRHGESELNRDNVYFGHLDPPLTQTGANSIINLSQKLKNDSITYDKILTSPLVRCRDTAIILNYLGKNIQENHNLKEINFGKFEGLSSQEIQLKYKKEFFDWQTQGIHFKFPSGESIDELAKRSIDFIENIKDSPQTFLVITHFGVINSIISNYISGSINNFWNYKPSLASYTEIEFFNDFCILNSFSNK